MRYIGTGRPDLYSVNLYGPQETLNGKQFVKNEDKMLVIMISVVQFSKINYHALQNKMKTKMPLCKLEPVSSLAVCLIGVGTDVTN